MQTIRFVFTLPDVRIVFGLRNLQQKEFQGDWLCCIIAAIYIWKNWMSEWWEKCMNRMHLRLLPGFQEQKNNFARLLYNLNYMVHGWPILCNLLFVHLNPERLQNTCLTTCRLWRNSSNIFLSCVVAAQRQLLDRLVKLKALVTYFFNQRMCSFSGPFKSLFELINYQVLLSGLNLHGNVKKLLLAKCVLSWIVEPSCFLPAGTFWSYYRFLF